MSTPLEDINYDTISFNTPPPPRHPPYISDRQHYYHLTGLPHHLTTLRDTSTGTPIKSPRRLEQICANFLVSETTFQALDHLPNPLYPTLLTEAILFREPRPISALVSTWPETVLNVIDHVPMEDDLYDDYLTSLFEGHDDVTLLDCFVLGLLKLKKTSRLQLVDFRGFSGDRRLCKELLRLPVLWMDPAMRKVETLHQHMSKLIDISEEKVASFLNRISAVYTNVDTEFKHQNQMDSVTIATDMHINIDDVPIGLSLQHLSPFKFKASKVWVKPLPDVYLPINHLPSVLNPMHVTHLEIEDASMSHDPCKQYYLYEALGHLSNLTSLSLPGCLDVCRVEFVAEEVSRHLSRLTLLTRVNLSYCDLRGSLHHLLHSLQGSIECLHLKDCRLGVSDLMSLLAWRPLRRLRELNLSSNNLQNFEPLVRLVISEAPLLTCFSISFCMLSTRSQVSILRHCTDCQHLKVLTLQSYIPPSRSDLLWLLEACLDLPFLQRVLIFPEVYAFPGDVEVERRENKLATLNYCASLMRSNGRPELMVE